MSATSTAAPTLGLPTSGQRTDVARTFFAILWRDLFVTVRELPTFLAQVILQPLFMVFVFGKVLTQLGFARPGFAELLLPGIIALTVTVTALQGTALPLVIDFSFTKEIEDRLLAPLPTSFVALEKVVFGMLRALIAGAIMFPIGRLVLGTLPFHADRLWILIPFLLLGAVMGAGLGLTLGTLVQPSQISIVFALVLTPLLFTGCSQYPWPSLSSLRWFQILTLLNPLTYMSEGVRAAMVPQVPHMHPWIAVTVLTFATIALVTTGVLGFMRRAID
jgi:ABC-2 type transport system permease protein